jgi:hypothetical protein
MSSIPVCLGIESKRLFSNLSKLVLIVESESFAQLKYAPKVLGSSSLFVNIPLPPKRHLRLMGSKLFWIGHLYCNLDKRLDSEY